MPEQGALCNAVARSAWRRAVRADSASVGILAGHRSGHTKAPLFASLQCAYCQVSSTVLRAMSKCLLKLLRRETWVGRKHFSQECDSQAESMQCRHLKPFHLSTSTMKGTLPFPSDSLHLCSVWAASFSTTTSTCFSSQGSIFTYLSGADLRPCCSFSKPGTTVFSVGQSAYMYNSSTFHFPQMIIHDPAVCA